LMALYSNAGAQDLRTFIAAEKHELFGPVTSSSASNHKTAENHFRAYHEACELKYFQTDKESIAGFFIYIARVVKNGAESLKQARQGMRKTFRNAGIQDRSEEKDLRIHFNRLMKRLRLEKPTKTVKALDAITVRALTLSTKAWRILTLVRRRDVTLLSLNILCGVRPRNMLEIRKRHLKLSAHGWYLEVGPQKTKPESCLAPLGRGALLQAVLSFFRETPLGKNDLIFRRRDRSNKSSLVWKPDAPAMTQKMLCDSYRRTASSPGFDIEANELHHRVAGYTGRRTATGVAARNGATDAELSDILGHAVNSETFKKYLGAPQQARHARRDELASEDG
jgi:integrase